MIHSAGGGGGAQHGDGRRVGVDVEECICTLHSDWIFDSLDTRIINSISSFEENIVFREGTPNSLFCFSVCQADKKKMIFVAVWVLIFRCEHNGYRTTG
jgi:hypothetical protein